MNRRKLILVDDSMAILNSYYVLLKKYGYLVFIASSGAEALLKSEVVMPDVMIADLQMPEMDGFQLIEAVRRHPHLRETPIILFSATLTEDDVARAKALGVIECVCKGRTSTEGLVDRIKRCVAWRNSAVIARSIAPPQPGSANKPLTAKTLRQEILEATQDVPDVRQGANLVHRLTGLLERPSTTFQDVTRAIESDSEIAARVLRVANSAYYVQREKTESVEDAVKKLGIMEICRLARAIVTLQMGRLNEEDEFVQQTLGRHACVVSSLAQRLAEASSPASADLAASTGLLHDVGIAFLLREFRDKYSPIWEEATRSHSDLGVLEREQLGIDHAEVGEQLLVQCHLPPIIAASIRLHDHVPATIRELDAATGALHEILWVADQAAACLGHGLPLPYDAEGTRWETLPAAFRKRRAWKDCVVSLQNGIQSMNSILQRTASLAPSKGAEDPQALQEVLVVSSDSNYVTWPEVVLYPRVVTRICELRTFSFAKCGEVPVIIAPKPEEFASCCKRASRIDGRCWIYDSRSRAERARSENSLGEFPADQIICSDLSRSEFYERVAAHDVQRG